MHIFSEINSLTRLLKSQLILKSHVNEMFDAVRRVPVMQ